jgi:pimeloyl-ACP methyl ester carboxylesterase
MRAAVERYGESFDLDRVGHLGHSYGGAAIFAMALRGYEREGWGRKAMLLFSTAPWYYFQVGVKEFVDFPAHAKLVVQVYEDDPGERSPDGTGSL